MHKPPYASLAALKRAIANRCIIQFRFNGAVMRAEPREITLRREGRGYLVTCWVLESSDDRPPGLAELNYWRMREMEVTGERFPYRMIRDADALPRLICGVTRRVT